MWEIGPNLSAAIQGIVAMVMFALVLYAIFRY
jgi:hypothetical protein